MSAAVEALTDRPQVPDVVAEFAARVPKARIEELDARHNIQEQRPAELAGLIAGFSGASDGR